MDKAPVIISIEDGETRLRIDHHKEGIRLGILGDGYEIYAELNEDEIAKLSASLSLLEGREQPQPIETEIRKGYAYSFDEEYYYGPHSSIEEAIEEAKGEGTDDEGVYVGEGVWPNPAGYDDFAGAVLDRLQEYEPFAGEWWENAFSPKPEETKDLNRRLQIAVDDWLKANPGLDIHRHFNIENPKSYSFAAPTKEQEGDEREN